MSSIPSDFHVPRSYLVDLIATCILRLEVTRCMRPFRPLQAVAVRTWSLLPTVVTMLNLVHLNNVLRQVVSAPGLLHTAILMTPAGHLISYAAQADSPRPKDEIHVVVGLSVEVWQEERDRGMGVVDSEVCVLYVILFPSETDVQRLCRWAELRF